MRLLIGRFLGETTALTRPQSHAAGELLDWWQIVRSDETVLVLRADRWRVGEAWLAYQVTNDDEPSLKLHAAFQPKGVPGLAYWALLKPVHRWAFDRMADHRIRRAVMLSPWPNARLNRAGHLTDYISGYVEAV